MVTTTSFDINVANVFGTAELREWSRQMFMEGVNLPPNTVANLFRLRITDELIGPAGGIDAVTALAEAEKILPRLLPFELRHGQRMDLNRPFGNGVDSDADGVVDEADESATVDGRRVRPDLWFPGNPGLASLPDGPYLDYTNGEQPIFPSGTTLTEPQRQVFARQMYARHLYSLMMMLRRPGSNGQIDLDGDNVSNDIETARVIAQVGN